MFSPEDLEGAGDEGDEDCLSEGELSMRGGGAFSRCGLEGLTSVGRVAGRLDPDFSGDTSLGWPSLLRDGLELAGWLKRSGLAVEP